MTFPSFEEFLRIPGRDGRPIVKGISVGHCVAGEDWDDGADARELGAGNKTKAHAHYTHPQFEGWICVRDNDDLGHKDRVSTTLMHEMCHLVARRGHDDRWRAAMRRFHVPIAKAWQKRVRRAG